MPNEVLIAITTMASIGFIAASQAISSYFMSRSIDRSFSALREDRKWLSERFLEILEPRFIEARQRIDAIDYELSLQEEAEKSERY